MTAPGNWCQIFRGNTGTTVLESLPSEMPIIEGDIPAGMGLKAERFERVVAESVCLPYIAKNHLYRLMTRLPHDSPLRFSSARRAGDETCSKRMARDGLGSEAELFRQPFYDQGHCMSG
jgi:hypothetical protein